MNQCRVCSNQDLLTSIFSKRGILLISIKLMSIAKIDISPGDGLPNKICTKCIERLDNCIEFIQLCENSDFELRRSFKNENVKTYNDINLEIDNYLTDDCKYSPKSDNCLFIDESISDSIAFEENISKTNSENEAEHLEGTELEGPDLNGSLKGIKKKSQKQQCFTCGKVMSSRFRLKTHLRTHTGERPFSCPHCSKNFSLAQNLKVHLRIHTGEKPLQCSICGESFAQSAGLAAHRRKHTGQMPYRCVLCPRSFRTVGHLQYHTRRHTGEKNFECDTCGRAFITRSDLKQHLRTHSGERPHICSVCGLRLTRASHLKRHMQHTHTNVKSFPCTKCSSKFTQQADLDKHIKKHLEQTDSTEK